MKTKTLKLLAIPVLLAASTIGYAETPYGDPVDIPLSIKGAESTVIFDNTMPADINIPDHFYDYSNSIGSLVFSVPELPASGYAKIFVTGTNGDGTELGLGTSFVLSKPNTPTTKINYTVSIDGTKSSETSLSNPLGISADASQPFVIIAPRYNSQNPPDRLSVINITSLKLKMIPPQTPLGINEIVSGSLRLKASFSAT